MSADLQLATPADVEVIAALRNATAADLTARFGQGAWSGCCTTRGVLFDLKYARIYIVRRDDATIATLRLATKKPWAIDRRYFTPVTRPLYLTSMAVAPGLQRQGIGRRCLEAARQIARQWPADSLCLDAFDHPEAGAGEFYRKCGFRKVGAATYRGVPLIYFEQLI